MTTSLVNGKIYVPIPKTAITVVQIAIVDEKDGSILWYNNNIGSANFDPENQRELAYVIRFVLKPMSNASGNIIRDL